MDLLKLKRTPLRSAFTKSYNALSEAITEASPDVVLIEQLLETLIDKNTRLSSVDEDILNSMLTSGVTEKDYVKEFDACEEYKEKLIILKQKVKCVLRKPSEENVLPNAVEIERNGSGALRLPEISLQKFDGDPRVWITFWEDLDVLGLTFRKDLYLASEQIYPQEGESKHPVTRLQERLIKKLGPDAYPFFFEVRYFF